MCGSRLADIGVSALIGTGWLSQESALLEKFFMRPVQAVEAVQGVPTGRA